LFSVYHLILYGVRSWLVSICFRTLKSIFPSGNKESYRECLRICDTPRLFETIDETTTRGRKTFVRVYRRDSPDKRTSEAADGSRFCTVVHKNSPDKRTSEAADGSRFCTVVHKRTKVLPVVVYHLLLANVTNF